MYGTSLHLATALEATELAVRLSLQYKRRLHILHLTTEEDPTTAHQGITEFPRKSADNTSASSCCYEKLGTLAQMNPPCAVRVMATLALKDDIINCIATDHAPHTLKEGCYLWQGPIDAQWRLLCHYY